MLGLPRIGVEADPGPDRRKRPPLGVAVAGARAAAAAVPAVAVAAAIALLFAPITAIAVATKGAPDGGVGVAGAVAAVRATMLSSRVGAGGAMRVCAAVEGRLVPDNDGVSELSLVKRE